MAINPSQTRWPTPARYLALILLLITLVGIIVFIKPVFSTVGLGFIFAFLFFSPVRWISRHLKGKYLLSAALFYVPVSILIVLIILWGLNYFVDSGHELSIKFGPAIAAFTLPDTIPGIVATAIQDISAKLNEMLLNILINLASFIGITFVALFFSFLLLFNLNQGRGALVGWVPDRIKDEILGILYKLDLIWMGFMTAQIIYCVVLSVASYLEYALLGVPYPFIMAVLTGVISLIPTIGGLLASLIVAIPCLLFGSTVFTDMSPLTFTVIVTLINIVITQVSYNFVALPVIGKFVRLPVAAVFVGVLAGVAVGNILVAFLTVPILSTLVIFGGYLLSKVEDRPYPAMEPDDRKEAGFFSQLLVESNPSAPMKGDLPVPSDSR
jgi:predicted PurR-regulated permease PerM